MIDTNKQDYDIMVDAMSFKPNTAVRLRATSELLLIDVIDDETATAFCRRFGVGGPEGAAQPYPLDSLRENVVRSRGPLEEVPTMSLISLLRCRIGLHHWQQKSFHSRPLLGDISGLVCTRCGEIRLSDV